MTTNVRRVKEECEKRLAAAYKHYEAKGPITPAKLPQVMLLTGISDFHKIEAELAKTRKDGDADVSLERAMELMWHGITAQQWLEMTNLPPVLDD
mmetsp:Transcript_40656/g.121269  ORF Transcript_40656/g.121269 Transcript_40656/m.121269 type:complete len:95 (+) Transcript_40656:635-919(+)